jgi:hypothetical protein
MKALHQNALKFDLLIPRNLSKPQVNSQSHKSQN